MKRRSFLLGLGTALAAPAIVRADSLMKLWVPPAPKLLMGFVDFSELKWTTTTFTARNAVIYGPGFPRHVYRYNNDVWVEVA